MPDVGFAAAAEWEAGLREADAVPVVRHRRMPKKAQRYLAPPAKYQPDQIQRVAARHSHALDMKIGGAKAEHRIAPFQNGAAQLKAELQHMDGLVRNVAAETRARAHQLLEAEQAKAAGSHGQARMARGGGGRGGGGRWQMSEHAAKQHLLIPGLSSVSMGFA